MGADRLLATAGFRNLRDLGGLPVSGGSRVRAGLLFRSEAPAGLSDDQLDELGELGLRSAIDLRAAEAEDVFVAPTLPHGVRRLEAGVVPPADPSGKGLLAQAMDGELVDYTAAELGAMYVEFLEGMAPAFGRALGYIAETENLPTLIHCHAGKDRTGLAVAMVLDVIGVPREVVLDDYELTTPARAYRREEIERTLIGRGTEWDRVAPLFTAPREALELALAHIEDAHGSVEAYLSGPGQLGEDRLSQLTSILVEPAP